MPDEQPKSESKTQPKAILGRFFVPHLGNGVSIEAETQEEATKIAEQQAKELKKERSND